LGSLQVQRCSTKPIATDGVLNFTGSWGVVFAVEPRTGKDLWRYDSQIPKETGRKRCGDAVNRAVAVR